MHTSVPLSLGLKVIEGQIHALQDSYRKMVESQALPIFPIPGAGGDRIMGRNP